MIQRQGFSTSAVNSGWDGLPCALWGGGSILRWHYIPQGDHPNCVQMLPHVPWGTEAPKVRPTGAKWWRVQGDGELSVWFKYVKLLSDVRCGLFLKLSYFNTVGIDSFKQTHFSDLSSLIGRRLDDHSYFTDCTIETWRISGFPKVAQLFNYRVGTEHNFTCTPSSHPPLTCTEKRTMTGE